MVVSANGTDRRRTSPTPRLAQRSLTYMRKFCRRWPSATGTTPQWGPTSLTYYDFNGNDVTGVEPDAVCVDALARLQLAAKGYGCRVRLENATPGLRELVAFMGLDDVLTA